MKHKRLRLNFSYQFSTEISDAALVTYLNSKPPSKRKEMILQALRAYWQVSAVLSESAEKENLLHIGQISIDQLKAQQKYISQQLNLPEEMPDYRAFVILLEKLEQILMEAGNSKLEASSEEEYEDIEEYKSVIDPQTFGMKGAFD